MNKLSILLIEDNVTIATQLTHFFEGHGWVIDYANNGNQGVALALKQNYDVIILDLNLPDIDGLEVCEQIKQQAKVNPPILMLTARDTFENKAEGYGIGADDYVTTPLQFLQALIQAQGRVSYNQLAAE